MNALELRGLTKHYKDFTLGPLDLTLPGGTICGLIGENGAGKSTTIRLILDMVQRDGGTVTILGRDNRTVSVRTKEEISVVLGSEGIPLCLNAVQAGKVMAGIYHNWDAAAYAELCQKFGLPDKKQYKDYSTGMKMKLCIAVALAHHPKLLLLDEATNGLDPVVRDEVIDLLLDFARDENHSILISSHIVSDLEKLCDTIAFLHKGRLLLCEEKDALREEYALWHGTAAQLAALDTPVYGKRVSPYGAEALVRRDTMPAGVELTPVSIVCTDGERGRCAMKGLLLKDAYQTWCYIRWIILVSIAMMLVGVFCMKEGSNFFMQYSGIMLGMLPMTLLAYDQNSRFSAYCAALPVTKEQIVGGKYLIGLCGMALAELLSMAALAAAQLLWGTVTVQLTVATLFQVAMLTLLGNIILLPLTYRFGYEKAKYVYYLCIGMLGGLMGITVSSGGILLNSILPAQGSLLVLVVVLAAALALYALSWRLSVAWYGKAEQ